MPDTAGRTRVVFTLPSFAAGGAERVLITLMNGLDRTRFSPELVCLYSNGPLRDLVAGDIPVTAPYNFSKVIYSLPFLWLTLLRKRPDMVVSTMAHMNFAVLLVTPFIPARIRVIVREAITPTFLINTRKEGKLIRTLYRLLYPRARRVICPAQRIIDEFKDAVDVRTGNFKLLYNPVNIDKIRALPPVAANDAGVHFICVGRLHPQKGFDRLIESLPFLNMNYPWRLTILGDGDQYQDLKQLIEKHGLHNKITLKGYTADPWPHVAGADCFLLPSRHEGLPNVALESLCVGTPVIAMREAGGITEIATLAGPKAVTLCDAMADFIAAMETVRPAATTSMRDSLLPDTFHPATVQKNFTAILDQAA